MDGLGNIASYGWAGAAALLVALLVLAFLRLVKREDAKEADREALAAELRDAEARHSAMLFAGDAAGAVREARRIDRLRKALGLGASLLVLALGGCRHPAPEPVVRTVALSEHCRVVHPGDTVPELPEGEGVFWLCTPTGLEMMMPADSLLPPRTMEGAE
jgi:hypothetical protein